jgi:hypothetical protein
MGPNSERQGEQEQREEESSGGRNRREARWEMRRCLSQFGLSNPQGAQDRQDETLAFFARFSIRVAPRSAGGVIAA